MFFFRGSVALRAFARVAERRERVDGRVFGRERDERRARAHLLASDALDAACGPVGENGEAASYPRGVHLVVARPQNARHFCFFRRVSLGRFIFSTFLEDFF